MGVLTSPGQTHCADGVPATVVYVYFQVWRRYPSPHSHVWGMAQCSLRCSCSSSFNRQGQPQSPSFDMWPRQSATFQQATLHHCTLPLLASLATLGLQHKNGSDSRYQLVDMQVVGTQTLPLYAYLPYFTQTGNIFEVSRACFKVCIISQSILYIKVTKVHNFTYFFFVIYSYQGRQASK